MTPDPVVEQIPKGEGAKAQPWNAHPVVMFNGAFDSNIKTGEDYATVTLADIFALAPTAHAKEAAPAFVPSSYHDYDAREHAVQRGHGQFVALCGDVDCGDHRSGLILKAVTDFAGNAAHLIYSSAHARPGDMRWRIILPLAAPVPFETWHDAQSVWFAFMEARGIVMDRALARAAQPVYLPNVPATHAKTGTPLRGEDGAPIYYKRKATPLDAAGLSLEAGPVADGIAALRRKRIEDERARERIRREAEKRRASAPRGEGASIIDEFNASNTVADMLALCDYRQSPRNDADWRSPQQTGETYATRIMGSKWVSLSESDAASGLGEKCAAGCYGDAYDIWLHYKHGGDHKAAFRALHEEQAIGSSPNRGAAAGLKDGECGVVAPQKQNDSSDGDSDLEDEDEDEDETPSSTKPRRGIRLSDFYAYMPAHNYIFAPTGELWPAASINSRFPPITLKDKRGNVIVDEKGKPKQQNPHQWLDQNRPVEQMTWAPGEAQVVANRLISDGGWIHRPNCSVFNLYRPPISQHGDALKAGPWIDHVNKVYPAEAAHIINWLAHRVQRPHEKINHAIVMGGAQGIGKDTILEPIKSAIGPWNFAEVSPQHMLGRFNGFVKSVILRVSEARDLGDVDRFAFYDHMKTYTAAPPDILRVDEKHVREYAVFNVCGVIITTNHKTDGIYLPADDRRHFVAWSDCARHDFEPEYWASIYKWYENGGSGHVAAYLSGLDLSGFDPKAPPEKTAAFWDIVSASQAPEDAELADALDILCKPDAITVELVKAAASDGFREFLGDRRNSRRIPHRFEECGYLAVRNRHATDGHFKVGNKRCVIYAKKTLSLQDQIAAAEKLIRR